MNIKIIITILAIIGIISLIIWGRDTSNKKSSESPNIVFTNNENDIISQKGIHWHPELAIYIKGKRQTIPANIGIGMQYAGYPRFDSMMMMTDMHTHDDSGMLHWEVMNGPIKKDDVRIGTFFQMWGKTFSKDCIFDECNGKGGAVKMFVNGKENTDFENYLVSDKDKIEIRYE